MPGSATSDPSTRRGGDGPARQLCPAGGDRAETLTELRGKLNVEPEVAGHARAVDGDGNFVW